MSQLSEEELCKVAFVMAIKDALNVVNGKWKLAIVCTMLSGPRRFSEMERLLSGLSSRMLARELRVLEISGVVSRIAAAGPSRATHSYALTDAGKQLENVIFSMADWGVEYRKLAANNG